VEHHFLVELVVLLVAAALGVALFERLRLPPVVGFLVTGAVIGPGVLGVVGDPDRVLELAEFGVVFLLFEIGLELPADRLRRSWRVTLVAGGLQVALTLATAAGAALWLGAPPPLAVLVGMLVAMSSTALVVRLVSERGDLDTPYGQLAVGILLFQDLCVVPFLLAVPLLATQGTSLGDVAWAVGRAVAALGVFTGLTRFVLPPLLDRVARMRSQELFTLVAVVIVIGSAVAAEAGGLSLAVGAFLAGLALRASPYGAQLFAETLPLRGVLLGVFFTAIGMLLDPAAALENWAGVALVAGGSLFGKALIVFAVLVFALRQGARVSVLTALALAQTGEFSFVLARAALDHGLLDVQGTQTFVAGSVISLIATPFLIRAGPLLASRLAGESEPGEARATTPVSGHVVLIGYGLSGRTLARVLRSLGTRVLALDTNAAAVSDAIERGEEVVYGDATRAAMLARLGVAGARVVVVAINDARATHDVVSALRAQRVTAPVLVRTRYVAEVDRIEEAGANRVVADEVEGTLDLLGQLLEALGHARGAVDRFVGELRDEGYGFVREPSPLGLDPWLVELLESVGTEWVDLGPAHRPATLGELDLRARSGASVLAVERMGNMSPNPVADMEIGPGDRLLLFGDAPALARARALLEP
jgi:CPA2 family monovalent cation:H+ antiporter-2